MNDSVVLARLRHFLLALSAALLTGTLLELWLTQHSESFVQLIPHFLCVAGLAATVVVLLRPRRVTVLCLRLMMVLVAAGAMFGVYQHIWNNFAFEREINPGASVSETILASLGGANPLLAPGILAVSAVLAMAATYYHPALSDSRKTDAAQLS